MDCVMTSSPTVFISSSIFSVLTRIEPPSPRPCFVGASLIRSLRRSTAADASAGFASVGRLTTFEGAGSAHDGGGSACVTRSSRTFSSQSPSAQSNT